MWFQKVRNVIKMALKLVFFRCKIAQRLVAPPYGLHVRLYASAAVTKYLVTIPRLLHAWVASVCSASGLNQLIFVQKNLPLVAKS